MDSESSQRKSYDAGFGHSLEFSSAVAERVVAKIGPKKVLVLEHAKGALVQGLRDWGVEAYGGDLSG